eukprot:CAMPEP_0175091182 /NCGR_PEP_ID=MMETSP0086_2-20121207/1760_1 /TAXON_ID=136419 /ORGANISM="Unknown Unknown, Strain D1" /LENGTH=90 /DNA_ID=CAMNT_0016363895 /DNA_START=8 /DNA_END=280 /DNA_ORIENTATION=+
MGKKKTVLIKLVSAAGTGWFYTTKKNPIRTPHKLAFRKYDPVVRQHVLFEEQKHKRTKNMQAKKVSTAEIQFKAEYQKYLRPNPKGTWLK